MQIAIYKAGQLLNITQGAYSDFEIKLSVQVVCDINFHTEVELFKAQSEPVDDHFSYDCDEFVAWLIAEGKVKEVDISQLHIGSYGSLKL